MFLASNKNFLPVKLFSSLLFDIMLHVIFLPQQLDNLSLYESNFTSSTYLIVTWILLRILKCQLIPLLNIYYEPTLCLFSENSKVNWTYFLSLCQAVEGETYIKSYLNELHLKESQDSMGYPISESEWQKRFLANGPELQA